MHQSNAQSTAPDESHTTYFHGHVSLLQVAFVPSNVFGVLATHYGLGAPDANITDVMEIRAIEYFMYYEILYFAASATTKVSITFTVLRLCDKQLMCRRIAIGNAIMMIAAAGISGVFVLTNCRPFDTYWNPDLYVSPPPLPTKTKKKLETLPRLFHTIILRHKDPG